MRVFLTINTLIIRNDFFVHSQLCCLIVVLFSLIKIKKVTLIFCLSMYVINQCFKLIWFDRKINKNLPIIVYYKD